MTPNINMRQVPLALTDWVHFLARGSSEAALAAVLSKSAAATAEAVRSFIVGGRDLQMGGLEDPSIVDSTFHQTLCFYILEPSQTHHPIVRAFSSCSSNGDILALLLGQ